MHTAPRLAPLAALLLTALPAWGQPDADRPRPETGTVRFAPAADEATVPKRYRLGPHTFEYTLTPRTVLAQSGVRIDKLTYPSPVRSPYPENNTVYAEYYRPLGDGPFPAVIVLDILGGDQSLSRSIATIFAQNGVAALFVQMAYYGPRRPAEGKVRLLSTDIPRTMEAVRQTVLDVRRAAAWLESRPEVDRNHLGILGTSLGSFMSALTAEMEPRLGRVALLLSGGGFVEAYYDHPLAAPYRKTFEALGGSKIMIARLLAPVDPLTYADRLKDHKLLMIAASRDDIVPPKMARWLWEASGKQRIVWYDATHIGAALYFLPAMQEVIGHFKSD
jgi:dienelactone hydrolase